MKIRNDITEFANGLEVFSVIPHKRIIYEHEGMLFIRNDDDEKCLIGDRNCWIDSLILPIEKEFGLKFSNENKIYCICGETDKFSARFGNNSILIKCNSCGNEFNTYSE